MKHIRKFNESEGIELDFEDFKMIVESDLLDNFDCEYEFENHLYIEERFYDCCITFRPVMFEDHHPNDISYDNTYLNELLNPYDEPGPLRPNNIIERAVDDHINAMESVKNSIDLLVRQSNEMKNFLKSINDKLIPRLSKFSNGYPSFGIDGSFRICFDLSEDYLERNPIPMPDRN